MTFANMLVFDFDMMGRPRGDAKPPWPGRAVVQLCGDRLVLNAFATSLCKCCLSRIAHTARQGMSLNTVGASKPRKCKRTE